jgi:transglutaminase-like putative cysteine protease
VTPAAHPLAPEMRAVSVRDLAGLLASLALVVGPHAWRAPLWLAVLTLCLYLWRAYLGVQRAPLPSRWLVLGIAALAMIGVWVEYRTIFGRTPGIILLMLFSGLKLLEMRTHRDAAVVLFLCYFLIITNFLYTQTIPTAVLMCLALVVITATLVGLNAPVRGPRANLRGALQLLAHAVPAALVLFLLFPRVQGPLWGLPQDASAGLTGLSDSMTPGSIARLALSDAIAFRAEFDGELPVQRLRYWRGPVLWDFDGRTWTMGPTILGHFDPPEGGLQRWRYGILLEPHNRNWLFALETAARLPERTRFSVDGQILTRLPVRSRVRYDLESVEAPVARTEEEAILLRRAARVPPGSNPRSIALAQQWRARAAADRDVLSQALAFLVREQFTYTLEPPLLGEHSVDEFLFGTKAGFCEHFASAFVFLMRSAGVPARVVTGYQGGELNPVDRIITVRQSDAHAWAEVWLQGEGWVRVDPTAAAIPGRIETGLARAVPDSDALPLLMRPRLEWLRSLRHNWEAIAHKWNIWVLDYNPDRQRDLMRRVGMRDADWRNLTAMLFTLLGLFTAALLIWSLRRLARPDPVQLAWQAFCRKLRARGVERAPHEGPRDFSERAARALPAASAAIERIGALYIALRYGAGTTAAAVAELRRRVRALRLT